MERLDRLSMANIKAELRTAMLAAAEQEHARFGLKMPEDLKVLPSGNSALVVKYGPIVIKAHSEKTNTPDLDARLRLIRQPALVKLFLQPLQERAIVAAGRPLSLWPSVTEAAVAKADDINWNGSGRLLACLHTAPYPNVFSRSFVPQAGWLSRLARTNAKLHASGYRPEKNLVLGAFASLPSLSSADWRTAPERLIHGDWHPGQLVLDGDKPLLIDIDDLGLGPTSFDLARPAAWYLAGFLSSRSWQGFLESYADAGGPIAHKANYWRTLELPARAAVIQDAAKSLLRAEREHRELYDFELELIGICKSITRTSMKGKRYATD